MGKSTTTEPSTKPKTLHIPNWEIDIKRIGDIAPPTSPATNAKYIRADLRAIAKNKEKGKEEVIREWRIKNCLSAGPDCETDDNGKGKGKGSGFVGGGKEDGAGGGEVVNGGGGTNSFQTSQADQPKGNMRTRNGGVNKRKVPPQQTPTTTTTPKAKRRRTGANGAVGSGSNANLSERARIEDGNGMGDGRDESSVKTRSRATKKTSPREKRTAPPQTTETTTNGTTKRKPIILKLRLNNPSRDQESNTDQDANQEDLNGQNSKNANAEENDGGSEIGDGNNNQMVEEKDEVTEAIGGGGEEGRVSHEGAGMERRRKKVLELKAREAERKNREGKK